MKRLIPVLLLLLPLGGCSTVRVPQPVGDTPVALDPAEWNGTWCAPDLRPMPGTDMLSVSEKADCYRVTVADGPGGVLDFENAKDLNDRGRLHLLSIGHEEQMLYGTEESNGGYELVIRLHHEAGAVTLWLVSGNGFANEIAAGRLPGDFDAKDVTIESLDTTVLGRIAADESGVLFDWREPAFLIRVNGGS